MASIDLTTAVKLKNFAGITDGDNASGISIQYTGAGSAATLTVAGDTLTTSVTGGPGSEDLSLDLTAAAYDTLTELAAVIDADSAYTCSVVQGVDGNLNSSSLAAVSAQDIKTAAYSAEYDRIEATLGRLVTSVSRLINAYTHRTLKSTAYALKRLNGTGGPYLNLPDYPVTAFTRLALGTRAGVRVWNTATGTSASAGVTATGLTLALDGTTDATVTFASYATLTTLVAAVNALGGGWVAEVADSSKAVFKSSDLLAAAGLNCINSNAAGLEIPDRAEDDFTLNADEGVLCLATGFPRGFQNVITDFTAGYVSGTHDDELAHLEHLANRACAYFWSKRGREGVSSFSRGGFSEAIDVNMRELPGDILSDLSWFMRILI